MSPLNVLLFCLLAICVGAATEGPTVDTESGRTLTFRYNPRSKGRSILIVTSPLLGHAIPSVSLASGLAARGHDVTVMAAEVKDVLTIADMCREKGLQYTPIPVRRFDREAYNRYNTMADRSTEVGSFLEIMEIIQPVVLATEQYTKAIDFTKWDIVVIEELLAASAVICYTKQAGVKTVMLVPHLVGDVTLNPPWPFPNLLYNYTDNMGFIERLYSAITDKLLYITSKTMFINHRDIGLAKCWREYGYWPPQGHHIPMLVTTAIGLEFSRTISPLTAYVGPLIDTMSEPLLPTLGAWLNSKDETSVLYISLGSSLNIDLTTAKAIVDSIPKSFSVLWSLKNENIVKRYKLSRSQFMVTKWVPQAAVLNHSSIAAVILHGGAGGIHEALYFGVPVIIIPFSVDQQGNTARVHQAGVGLSLPLADLDPKLLHSQILTVTSGNYSKEAKRVGRLLHEAGGLNRACDLIELYADVGYDHLVPAYAKYGWSWVAYSNIDVYCVSVLCLCAGGYATLRICQCCCCRRCCKRNKQKKD